MVIRGDGKTETVMKDWCRLSKERWGREDDLDNNKEKYDC